MEAEEAGGAAGHSTGRKLVPWSSWAEWCFVRDAIFSSYPHNAVDLRRIAAWRSRGCLPIPVDVTASFVDIRLRDPVFQNGVALDAKLESEDMLAMLYSMSIMRDTEIDTKLGGSISHTWRPEEKETTALAIP